jgi:hypothetical protein
LFSCDVGKPAAWSDVNNVDWFPHIQMGYELNATSLDYLRQIDGPSPIEGAIEGAVFQQHLNTVTDEPMDNMLSQRHSNNSSPQDIPMEESISDEILCEKYLVDCPVDSDSSQNINLYIDEIEVRKTFHVGKDTTIAIAHSLSYIS